MLIVNMIFVIGVVLVLFLKNYFENIIDNIFVSNDIFFIGNEDIVFIC